LPTAAGLGVKWAIDGAEAQEFPKDKPPKPFMYQGNATLFELTSPSGVKTALQLPAFSYQQLQDNRELLWITDPISWHKYLTERKAAAVKVLAGDSRQIRLQLACTADPVLYDLPLTLATRVPSEWKACLVTQGPAKTSVPAVNGVVRYPAMPGAVEIVLQPEDASR
jgi:hypothetical protein